MEKTGCKILSGDDDELSQASAPSILVSVLMPLVLFVISLVFAALIPMP